MLSVRRIASTALAIVLIVAAALSRPAVVTGGRHHGAQGCQAAAPAGRFATIDAVDVAGSVHSAASTPGVSSRAGKFSAPAPLVIADCPAFAFARPHDPRHLHTFSLLI